MRCIIRPLLFLQSCFYVILGKINSIIDQLQNHVVQELDCWCGPSFMVWNSFLSGMGVSWAGLQWWTFLQVLNIYSEERECLMHYWLWRPMSMPPCLPHPSQYCNLGIMRKLQSYFRRNHSFIWSSWLHHLLPQLCLLCLLLLHHNLGVCDYPVHLWYYHCSLPVNPYVWQLTFSNDVYSSRYEIEKVIVAALKESMK